MRLVTSLLAFATLACIAPLAARADVVTNFTLTHGSDTIQFSISDSTPFNYRLASYGAEEFDYQIPFTLDGTVISPGPSQYAALGFTSPEHPGTAAAGLYVGYVSGVVNGIWQYTYYYEAGVQVYTNVNGLPAFTPETITFRETGYLNGSSDTQGSGDTLVVTQSGPSASPVPEPTSLALVGTGLAGAMGVVRRRLARNAR